ncbi:MAG: 6-bladed beta-propeller [Pseudomonadota bacterium]
MRWAFLLSALIALEAAAGGSIAFRFERLLPALQQPWYFAPFGDLAVDSDNFVYVVEQQNNRVRKFTRAGQLVTTFGQPTSGGLLNPRDVAIDEAGFLYVTDGFNHRVVVYTKNGEFLRAFGEFGSGPGQFDVPFGIAFFGERLYVADSLNHRIQILETDGSVMNTLGGSGPGSATGQFDSPVDVSIAPDGRIYIADTNNNRIQFFDQSGTFLGAFGSTGSGPGQFEEIRGVEVDTFGIVYVIDAGGRVQRFDPTGLFLAEITMPAEELPFNQPRGIAKAGNGRIYVRDLYRVSQFAPNGDFVDGWASSGDQLGQFNFPLGIDANSDGQLFVADQFNHRIVQLDATGSPVQAFGTRGAGPLQFNRPIDITLNGLNQLVVSDSDNHRVQVIGTDFAPVREFGSFGTAPGQFNFPFGVAVDDQNNIYVSDTFNHRIQQFQPDGTFIREWGSEGSADGQFREPGPLAIDGEGNLFVADRLNDRIQKFEADGTHLLSFGTFGEANGQFDIPEALGFDSNGFLFVADTGNNRYQAFTITGEYVGKFDQSGIEPGQITRPGGIYFDDNQNVFMVDARNNRLQRFNRLEQLPDTKVVIVAGGGPYAGNPLWDATQVNANFAYRTLVVRGFGKDTIQYLSPDVNLDIDQNGLADDVDEAPTAGALERAIDEFADDAGNLLLYLVDHGGENTFRLTESEVLGATTLAQWIDAWQAARPGSRVTVIYDACQSGSFMDELRNPAFDRVLITSSDAEENAYFVSQGALSFSNRFWTGIFNGATVGEAFDASATATGASFPLQTPLLDANGDGVFNSPQDRTAVMSALIGTGGSDTSDAPLLGSVSPPQTIASGTVATVTAEGVVDADGIARVWGVLRPPGFVPASPDNPVQDLPTIDLVNQAGTDDYALEFSGFTDVGTYQLAVHAQDRLGNISAPALTTVTVDNPLRRRAIVVHGGDESDEAFAARQGNAALAVAALSIQGYGADGVSCSDASCDDIFYLSNAAVPGTDGTSTRSNLEFALTTWGVDDVQDLTVYFVGPRSGNALVLSDTDSVSLIDLDSLLDVVQTTVPGVLTVVVDADSSEDIVTALTPDTSQTRYLISSTEDGDEAINLSGGEVSFSQFFWTQVLNGARLRAAFVLARNAVLFNQSAQLDSNGNGVSNDFTDGVGPQDYFIGSGVALAGDDPFVGGLAVNNALTSDFETVTVSQVTSTGKVDRVVLLAATPDGSIVSQPLPKSGGTFEDRSYGLCGPAGDYTVAAFAVDMDGNVSLPNSTVVSRAAACDDFFFFAGFE